MRPSTRSLLAAAILIASLATAGDVARADPIVEFEGRYWITDLTSRVKSTQAGVGTNINLAQDLGVDAENLSDLRVGLNAGPFGRFRLGYVGASLSGDRFVGKNIVFGGGTFPIGTRVATDFEANYLRFGWLWQVSFLDIVKLGPMLEAKGFWGKASLESTVPPNKKTETFAFGLPTIGAALNVTPLQSVDLFAEVSGIPGGDLGYFIDAEAGVKYIPWRFVSIVGGYRMFDVKIESGGDSARLLLHGPFIGLTVRF